MIRVQVEPPSVEYSSFTVGMFPSVDHVIVVGSPTVKVCPPFGAVTVTVPVTVKLSPPFGEMTRALPWMVRLGESFLTAGVSLSDSRTFAVEDTAEPGIVQA